MVKFSPLADGKFVDDGTEVVLVVVVVVLVVALVVVVSVVDELVAVPVVQISMHLSRLKILFHTWHTLAIPLILIHANVPRHTCGGSRPVVPSALAVRATLRGSSTEQRNQSKSLSLHDVLQQ